MPLAFIPSWHYRCALTGTEVAQGVQQLPDRWAQIGAEFYSPAALGIIARRILAHPDAEYSDITSIPYPDPTLDES